MPNSAASEKIFLPQARNFYKVRIAVHFTPNFKNMDVLKTTNLTKHYGKITAVDGLNLEVESGNVMGILGPNGSGKTTTLGMILGITHPDSGRYEWFGGVQQHHARRRVGAILETPNFYPYLNADDNLEIIAHIKKEKNPKIDELLELVKLRERRKSKFKTYSLGMKQRLAIAAAMVGDPDVLIFDEPTNGLDPQGIAGVRETILEIANRGKTILMASHILDEVEKICSHVAIIKNGHLLATGTVGAIINQQLEIELAAKDLPRLAQLLEALPYVFNVSLEENQITANLEDGHSTAEINQIAFQRGIVLTHLLAKRKSLEEEFLEITKGK
jgi:ABC-type multidrug transport system ATPase subunit